MARLLVHVEGETEEAFVNEVLADHLQGFGYLSVAARLIGGARQRERRGGIRAWRSVREDIIAHLKEDSECLATTMVDFYAMPRSGASAWPGRADAASLPFGQKVSTVQDALLADVCKRFGKKFNPARFVPFVMMHEFEAMLFSNCAKFASGIGQPDLAPRFQEIRDAFQTPEQINDSLTTTPSKRIAALMQSYQKPFHGPLAVLEIGLPAIRAACPHVQSWLERLEAWPQRPLPV